MVLYHLATLSLNTTFFAVRIRKDVNDNQGNLYIYNEPTTVWNQVLALDYGT